MLQSGVRISMLYHVVPAVKEPAVTEPAAEFEIDTCALKKFASNVELLDQLL